MDWISIGETAACVRCVDASTVALLIFIVQCSFHVSNRNPLVYYDVYALLSHRVGASMFLSHEVVVAVRMSISVDVSCWSPRVVLSDSASRLTGYDAQSNWSRTCTAYLRCNLIVVYASCRYSLVSVSSSYLVEVHIYCDLVAWMNSVIRLDYANLQYPKQTN